MFPEESGLVQDPVEHFFVDKSHHELEDAALRIAKRARRFEELTEKLGLKQLLDLPLVALSNGQTRRARIVKALLEQPEILLLDEPLSVCHVLFLCMARLTRSLLSRTGHQNASHFTFSSSFSSCLQQSTYHHGTTLAGPYTRVDHSYRFSSRRARNDRRKSRDLREVESTNLRSCSTSGCCTPSRLQCRIWCLGRHEKCQRAIS